MALVKLLTDLAKFKYTNYKNVGANNSPIGGRHGGYKGGGEPPHPEEHSKFDDKSGVNLSQIKGRHGGIEPLGQPPHPEAHSLYDDGVGGIGNPQSFTVRGYTVSDIISGRHGGTVGPTPAQPPHPDDHSEFDNGVGFGVAPSDNPQSFNVRGYTVTGNKRFYIGWQGDIMNHPLSDYGIGAFDTISGVFDHTQTRDKLRKVYSNYPEITFGTDIDGGINGLNGSIHIGNQDIPEVVGGGLSYYGSLVSITPRGSIYRNSEGQYQVPQEGRNTNPPGGISGIPEFTGTQITHNIPKISPVGETWTLNSQPAGNSWELPIVPNAHGSDFMVTPLGGTNFLLPSHIHYTLTHNVDMITLSGPTTQDYQTTLNTTPILSNAHGSDFMIAPSANYVSQYWPHWRGGGRQGPAAHGSLTHQVDMITLTGPTTQDYQTELNVTPKVDGAHGSDFQTTPIEAYSSIFATQDGLLMDTIYDSGFNRSDMYIKDHLHQSHPEFKVFNRTDDSLKRIKLDSPNFDSDGNEFFTFKDRIPYNIPARDDNVFGFDQPFILKDIGDRWGPGGLGAIDEGLFRGGFVTSAARTVADVLRIGKFILTPKGIMFGLKQAGLQLLNPFPHTRIWNPLSLGSLAPMVHIHRHWGHGTYEEAIDKDGWDSDGFGSILDGYADAVISPVPSVGLIFTTGRRATLAHAVAMVPSRGGKMALPGIPELKWSDFPVGNIDSLSRNILKVDGQRHGGLKTPYVYMDADSRGGLKNHAIVGKNTYGAYGVKDFNWGKARNKRDPIYYKHREFGGTKSSHIQLYGGATGVVGLDTNWQFNIAEEKVKETGVFKGDYYHAGRNDPTDDNIYFKKHTSLVNSDNDDNFDISKEDSVYIDKTTKFPKAQGYTSFAIPGSTIGHKNYITTPIGDEINTFGGISRGDRVIDKLTFKGNIYKYDKEGKSAEGAYYWHKDKGLITNETHLTLSNAKSLHLGPTHYITGEKYPQARPTQFYKISGDTVEPGVIKPFATDPVGTAYGPRESRGTRIFITDVFKGDLYKKGGEYSKGYVYTEGFTIEGVSDNHISITNNKATQTVAYKGALHDKTKTVLGAEKTYTVDLTKPPVPIKITGVFQGDQYSKESTYLSNKGVGDNQYIQIGPAGGPTTDSETGKIIWTTPAKLTDKLIAISKTTYIHPFWPTTAGQKYRYASTKFEDEVGSTGKWVGSAAAEGQLNIVPSFKDDVTGNSVFKSGGFISDLYDSGEPYSKSPKFIIASATEPPKTSPLKKTRLQTDQGKDPTTGKITATRGEPVVRMATAHWKGQKGFGTRLETDGESTLTQNWSPGGDQWTLEKVLKPLKLINFPLLNETGKGGNVGTEGQALGFIGQSGRTDLLAGNLYGYPELGRSGIIKWPSVKTTMEIINTSVPVMCHNHDGRVGEGGVPIGSKYNYGNGKSGTCELKKEQDQFLTEKISILVESGQKTYSERLFMPSVVPGEFPWDPKIGFSRFGIHKATATGEDGKQTPSQSPIAAKQIAYRHPSGAGDKIESPSIRTSEGKLFSERFEVPSDGIFDESQRISSKTVGAGNVLDRYKTLAYGDIPNADNSNNRYDNILQSASEIKSISTNISTLLSKPNEGIRNKAKSKVDAQGNPGTVTTRVEIRSTGGFLTDKPLTPQDDRDIVTQQVTVSDNPLTEDPNLGLIKKTLDGKYITPLIDKVNMHPYGDEDNNDDFIKFKFYDLVNKKYIIFRASLSGISETISPEWSSERYIGRPDNVHVYQGVERSMSFEFMVVPTSKQELPVLWEKLNYLVGLTYPTWKKIGVGNRMEGPFMNLTIGDMYVDTPGFLSSLSITVDDNSPWELDEGFQLPHAINVSCEFTHIGKYPLASQGKHYDLGWLRKYKDEVEWVDGNSNLGDRPMLGPIDGNVSLFKTPALQ